MNRDVLVRGFKMVELKRVETLLEKLLQYIDTDKMAIVGGLAIQYLISRAGIKHTTRRFNDLDIMLKTAGAISPNVVKNFLIYHYHPTKKNSFFIAVVDPVLRIKVDIFDWDPPLEDYIVVKFGNYKLKMRSPEDQLVKTVFDLQRISVEKKVDPKQFLDATLLMKIANLKSADNLWKKRNFSDYPGSIVVAYERANTIAKEHPDWIKEYPFKKPKPFLCPECKNTNKFKIAPMKQIYEILGYVE